MKLITKLLSVTASALLCAAMIAGCGNKNSSSEDNSSDGTENDTGIAITTYAAHVERLETASAETVETTIPETALAPEETHGETEAEYYYSPPEETEYVPDQEYVWEPDETEYVSPERYPDEQKYAEARSVAEKIAAGISGSTDLEKITAAAQTVADYCSRDTYTMSGDDYATAYGVFIKGEYSCAGATRALGMVLECMGYSWHHVNENLYTHQWVEVSNLDGQLGWADGQIGMADYGQFPFAERIS